MRRLITLPLTLLTMFFTPPPHAEAFSFRELCSRIADEGKSTAFLALGETHGTREFSTFKCECVKQLLTDNSYRFLVLEASMSSSFLLNKYIHGENVQLLPLLNKMYYIYNTPEFVNLVNWMREYNHQNQKKIHVIGVDFQDPAHTKNLLRQFFERWDSNFLATFDTASNFRIMDRLNELSTKVPQIPKTKIDLAVQFVELLKQMTMKRESKDRFMRDRFMAKNLNWHYRRSFEGSKGIIWGHNFHIAKNSWPSVVETLNNEYNLNSTSVGLLFGEGSYLAMPINGGEFSSWEAQRPPKFSIESYLLNIYKEVTLVDLRKNFGESFLWSRDIGWAKLNDEFKETRPTQSYDLVLFFPKGSTLILNP